MRRSRSGLVKSRNSKAVYHAAGGISEVPVWLHRPKQRYVNRRATLGLMFICPQNECHLHKRLFGTPRQGAFHSREVSVEVDFGCGRAANVEFDHRYHHGKPYLVAGRFREFAFPPEADPGSDHARQIGGSKMSDGGMAVSQG
jgi:hypothetical protein